MVTEVTLPSSLPIFAKKNIIILLCIPPNTSHALQPLDVGVFHPLKSAWKDIIKQWFRETRMQNIDKASFPSLLKQLQDRLQASWAVGGFKV